MSKIANILQWIGFIFTTAGLIIVSATDPVNMNIVGIFLATGIVIAIIGVLLGDKSKFVIFALFLSLLALITYLYVGRGAMFNVFMITALLIMPIDLLMKKIKKNSDKYEIT